MPSSFKNCDGNRVGDDDTNLLTPLLYTFIWSVLPTGVYLSYVCSAGSGGYSSIKEMLQNGHPGNILLLESGDLRNVVPEEREEIILPTSSTSSSVFPPLSLIPINCCFPIPPSRTSSYSSMFTEVLSTSPFCRIRVVDENCDKEDDIVVLEQGVPRNVPTITFLSNLRTLPPNFLQGCRGLKSTGLDLSPLSLVTVIRADFLRECIGLKTLDLSPLTEVSEIHTGFMYECTHLTSLDLSPLSKVTVISEFFLAQCSDLASLTLCPEWKVTHISGCFLYECVSLTSLDLRPLSFVTDICGGFLFGCDSLTSLDLSPLSKVTDISDDFLALCSGLTPTVDLQPLSGLKSIPSGFLHDCTGLTSLDLTPLSQVTEITDLENATFLKGCTGLTSVDLSPLSHLTGGISL